MFGSGRVMRWREKGRKAEEESDSSERRQEADIQLIKSTIGRVGQ